MPFITKNEIKAVAYLVGITIGAGVLALPYVFAQTGFVIGVLELLFVWLIVTLLTLYLAEVVLRTKKDYEVAGLTRKYLGKKWELTIVIVSVLYIYGALLAYGLGLGEALHSLFGLNNIFSSVVTFLFLSAIVYFGLEAVTKAELLLTPFIFLIIFAILFSAYDKINVINYASINIKNGFLPFGPLFFALLGFWCVPDMKKIAGNRKSLKKTVIIGIAITAFSYLLFTAVVVGVTGAETSKLFSISLSSYTNGYTAILLHLFTVFAIITSFLALGFTLKAILKIDYKFSNMKAWLCTFVIPFILLFFVKGSFIDVITVVGAGASVFVIFILILMFYKAKQKSERKPEFNLPIPKAVNALIVLFCIIIALYTIWVYGARLI
ncbi:hypothetical protein COV16_07055 [Candidatus Woesearchaeota archaeon CG10_big_fil_rev_8_21_14_0_10_34_8]|nr:MAG: hypothetical protein COV16_07055 [Candidatus Woesearchaeota archaeon CG10_big_fil_rev_8_21_14_0_10_34_8]